MRTAPSALRRSRLIVETSFSIRSRFLPIGSVSRRNSASRFCSAASAACVSSLRDSSLTRSRSATAFEVASWIAGPWSSGALLLGPAGDDVDERRGEREHGYCENDGHPTDGDDRGRRSGAAAKAAIYGSSRSFSEELRYGPTVKRTGLAPGMSAALTSVDAGRQRGEQGVVAVGDERVRLDVLGPADFELGVEVGQVGGDEDDVDRGLGLHLGLARRAGSGGSAGVGSGPKAIRGGCTVIAFGVTVTLTRVGGCGRGSLAMFLGAAAGAGQRQRDDGAARGEDSASPTSHRGGI